MDEEVSQHSGADAESEFTSAIYGEMTKSPHSVASEEDTLHGGGATGDSSSTATTAGGGSGVIPPSLFSTDGSAAVASASGATTMNVRQSVSFLGVYFFVPLCKLSCT